MKPIRSSNDSIRVSFLMEASEYGSLPAGRTAVIHWISSVRCHIKHGAEYTHSRKSGAVRHAVRGASVSWIDIVAGVTAKLGLGRASRARGPLLLMYHGLSGNDGVDPADFASQVQILRSRRRVVPLRTAIEQLGSPEAGKVASITFDDAYCDFADLALPVLERLALHATVFVPVGHVGGYNAWDRGRKARREIMSATQLRALPSDYVALGVHGFEHCRLAGLSSEALGRETTGARAQLEDFVGHSIDLFAYPFGQADDFDVAAECAVERAGFVAACSTMFGRGSSPGERFRLRRVGINPDDTLPTVARKLDGAYDWVASKESLGLRWRRLRARRGRRGEGSSPSDPAELDQETGRKEITEDPKTAEPELHDPGKNRRLEQSWHRHE